MVNRRFETHRACFALFAGLLILYTCGARPAHAGSASSSKASRFAPDGDLRKVSPHLSRARALARSGRSLDHVKRSDPMLKGSSGGFEMEVRFRDLSADAVDRVRSLARKIRGVYPDDGRIVGDFDLEVLEELAAVPGVRTIHPVYPPMRRVGSTTSQADSSIRAALARSTFGIDGTGVKVGVLSDSFHDTIGGVIAGAGCQRLLGGSAPQSSADLPPAVAVLDDGPGGQSDEGAGLAELIHDLAPGAEILFHSAVNSESDFAQGITELRSCGADVIVDDIGYLAEPMFQDGIIAQAAEAAVGAGVAYFSAAGNESNFGVDQQYSDTIAADDESYPATGNDFHDFGGGDRFAAVTLAPGCSVFFILQWNEPFDGVLGAGAASDLDLYLCDSANAASCAPASDQLQGCSFGSGVHQGDPLEVVSVDNPNGTAKTLQLAVEHVCGNQNVRLRIGTYSPNCELGSGVALQSTIFKSLQIYGHPAARGVAAVGATFYGEIDSGGLALAPANQLDVEPFSSLGGQLGFYFAGNGTALPGAPVLRSKPEIVAPDGSNTSFFGSGDLEGDGFPNFFGTSAAAAHAAAGAALMLEANQSLAPADLLRRMRRSAIDMEKPGRDALAGDGLLDAFNATHAALAPAPRSPAVIDFDGDGKTDVGVYRPSNGRWYIDLGRDGQVDFSVAFGVASDIPVPADYDGDGRSDIAVFRPSSGRWYIDGDLNGTVDRSFAFGVNGDVPVPADYDGNGTADVAVFRPSSGRWYFDLDANGTVDRSFPFGLRGDVPVPKDYDGDGADDVAVFRPSNGGWYVDLGSNGNVDFSMAFGIAGDVPVPGDWNDDGVVDLAVFRPSNGRWYVDLDRNGTVDVSVGYGIGGDVPVPGDYDGDFALDFAVFRPSAKAWFMDTDRNATTNLAFAYGVGGDIPLRDLGWVRNAMGFRP